jgi:putative glutamine amidotransferase
MAAKKPTVKQKTRGVPRILVLEGLSGAARCVRLSGADAIVVKPHDLAELDEALRGPFHGLVLTGGGDIDPRLYGEKPHKHVYGVSELRDYAENEALDEARERGVPVLGICRGHQQMTVHNGGALRQHIAGHRGIDHIVFGESGSRFRRVIGHDTGFFVSLHHQVVRRTGDGWNVAARAKDGGIEAVESRDGRCLGVQFHPEMDYGTNEQSRRIFTWLVNEAASRAGMIKPRRIRVNNAGSQVSRASAFLPPPHRVTQEPYSMQPVRPRQKAPVKVSWLCPKCGMRFDKHEDREDHVFFLHDMNMSVVEPPAGHPDWEPKERTPRSP